MIFLIEYERDTGLLLRADQFIDSARQEAEDRRLVLEIDNLRARVSREIVLLEAATESDLRRTHRRYFERIEDLTRMSAQSGV